MTLDESNNKSILCMTRNLEPQGSNSKVVREDALRFYLVFI